MLMMMDMNFIGMIGMIYDYYMYYNSTGMDMGIGYDYGFGGMGYDMGYGMYMLMNGFDECGNGMVVSIKKFRVF